MLTLEPLRPDHADALLAFELANRAYFTRTVPDRGDAYFADFPARHAALLAEQAAGICHFHAIVSEGTLVGRVNLIDVEDGSAELGYRIAESAAGRGLAKAAVAEVLHLATTTYALTALTARTTLDNPASMAVLTHHAFTPVEEFLLDGRPALRYRRALT
ncbi:GNAT family N-acetyltransferase [Streptomyces rubellomurinus]|uniref:GCN5 family acetyltransferase n=1 Tax=Streptomyces rubellomurinus (strain ATCC 31215) TaxID=359131 RepID=A0A0F2TAZ6_STRR3|nr:GNAT family N-acetyltransferase [Streptomyces rubellomurinus]KJS59631.1 GCN5 family acetyltransferase [Streptomyces rubellomurinus]